MSKVFRSRSHPNRIPVIFLEPYIPQIFKIFKFWAIELTEGIGLKAISKILHFKCSLDTSACMVNEGHGLVHDKKR